MLPAVVILGISAVPITLAAIAQDEAAVFAALGSTGLLMTLGFIYILTVSVVASAGLVNYAVRGNFGAMFAFSDIFARLRSGSAYFAAWGMTVVFSILASTVGSMVSWIPLLGWWVYGTAAYLESQTRT